MTTVWLMSQLKDLGFKKLNLVTIFSDNEGSIKLTYDSIFHFKTKHITTCYHVVRKRVKNKEIHIQCPQTTEQIAKLLIKLLRSSEMLFILLVLKTKCIKGHSNTQICLDKQVDWRMCFFFNKKIDICISFSETSTLTMLPRFLSNQYYWSLLHLIQKN